MHCLKIDFIKTGVCIQVHITYWNNIFLQRIQSIFRITSTPPMESICEYTGGDADQYESSTLKYRKQIAKQAADACAAAVTADMEVCVNSGETGEVEQL